MHLINTFHLHHSTDRLAQRYEWSIPQEGNYAPYQYFPPAPFYRQVSVQSYEWVNITGSQLTLVPHEYFSLTPFYR
jgi:hypothetical protein